MAIKRRSGRRLFDLTVGGVTDVTAVSFVGAFDGHGYIRGSVGVLAPSDGQVNGAQVNEIHWRSSLNSWRIILEGTLSQDHFSSVSIEFDPSTFIQLDTATATSFTTTGGESRWTWSELDDIWDSGDAGESRAVTFTP